jgi:hypothetical protein
MMHSYPSFSFFYLKKTISIHRTFLLLFFFVNNIHHPPLTIPYTKMTRRLMNRLSHLFKEKPKDASTIPKVPQDPKPEKETAEITNKENKPNLKRDKSLSRRASIWLDGKLQKNAGKRKRKSHHHQDETIAPLRVWTQQEAPESYLSGKVEIPSSAIPISYSSFSISQPLSSSSSSGFSINHLIMSSHIISSDQETLATMRTSIDRQDKKSVASALHLQQFEYEPRSRLDLAENVRMMLGDAISLADRELENE